MSQITINHRADDLDAQSIRNMQQSSAWQVYAAKIDRLIAQEAERCQDYSLDVADLRKAQYTLAALRMVKALPDVICKEVQRR